MHYNWHRYYDPETGRYLTPDPIGLAGGMNPFVYSYNNPINYVDPNGLWGWVGSGIGAVSGAIGGAVTGYASDGISGSVLGGGVGFVVGGFVGFVAPNASTVATSVIYSALTSAAGNYAGQASSNLFHGNKIYENYSVGSTLGSAFAGGLMGPFSGISKAAGYGLWGQIFGEGMLTGLYSVPFQLFGDIIDGGAQPFDWVECQQ